MTSTPLNYTFNAAVQRAAQVALPEGYDVASDAPQSYAALVDHYERTGRVCVWDGASDKTIFGTAFAHINHAFRAWHDSKHILYRLPFTFEGKAAACALQQCDLRELYPGPLGDTLCAIVHAEIIGQFQFCELFGGFPRLQWFFVSDYLKHGPMVAFSPRRAREFYGISKPGN